MIELAVAKAHDEKCLTIFGHVNVSEANGTVRVDEVLLTLIGGIELRQVGLRVSQGDWGVGEEWVYPSSGSKVHKWGA